MSATTWLIIAIVGFSLSVIALVVTVFMFIKMNILSVIGDLSGRTVAKEIKEMRNINASSGDKRFRSSQTNINRGMLTEKVHDTSEQVQAAAHKSKRLDKTTGEIARKTGNKKSGTVGLKSGMNVEPIIENNGSLPTEVLDEGATEVLSDNATEVLDQNATEVLSGNATTVLSEETTVLSNTEQLQDKAEKEPIAFKITKDVIVTHSDEVI